MIRRPDWEQRLADYLASVADVPHAYGRHDCALHGANAVLALTGEDAATRFRGRYQTEIGAARALRRFGAGSVEATFDATFPAIPPALARRGDLVMADGAIGVCVGGEAVFAGETGQVRWPRADWTRAWRVGA
ncbi:DUF6950 family protein [Sphingomonas aracearum]|uniref:DUF6950 domain-containing protein n=1 Tax=Sphingomonas aracearum TaxID=2283317 RepID=A0A369W033_9SPHN|nr:hypothetical protein [Sphingomonas aracearum]RDE05441.1 hypothetical protein DVW87_09325 [Sphingomonas aracearum]